MVTVRSQALGRRGPGPRRVGRYAARGPAGGAPVSGAVSRAGWPGRLGGARGGGGQARERGRGVRRGGAPGEPVEPSRARAPAEVRNEVSSTACLRRGSIRLIPI